MKPLTFTRAAVASLLLLPLGLVGCDEDTSAPRRETAKVPAKEDGPPAKKVEIGKNVYLEIRGKQRRVLVNAEVCLRRCDNLEELLCRKFSKEHESILAADVDARHIHAALIAAGAEAGSPVQFPFGDKPYKPARGTRIKIHLKYKDKGQDVTVPAQRWVRDLKTKKDLEYDWVFAGSRLHPPPEAGAPPVYEANSGDVICVANMPDAMLDLPVESTKSFENRQYGTATERIPPKETPVLVILEPVLPAKKMEKK
jgi:hypothetical protein